MALIFQTCKSIPSNFLAKKKKAGIATTFPKVYVIFNNNKNGEGWKRQQSRGEGA